jgi:hypothetical protein
VSDSAIIRLNALGKQLHEGRFAVTISADDSNSFGIVYTNGYRAKNRFSGKLKRNALGPKQVGH